MHKSFIKFILVCICLAFSTASFAQKFSVKSNPEGAEIFVYSDANDKPERIGKTPYKQNLNELIQTYVKKNTFIIELRKKGFQTYRILFAKTTNIDIDLSVNMIVSDKLSTIKEHDMMMIALFEVQKLIRGRNYADALKKLDTLEEDYEGFSIISELKATTYYMQKNVEKALSYYRKAFSQNSDNVDAFKMKVYLEKKLGVDVDSK
jgi:tetratricopeptide (TPR) repeat protein